MHCYRRRRARHTYAASKLSRHLAANGPAHRNAGAMPEFYNGAIDFQPVEEEDQRPKINAACEPGCSSAWKNYLACGERIEAKVGPYCSFAPAPHQPRSHPVRARSLAAASLAPLRPRAPQAVARAASFCLRLSWPPARAQGSGDCSSWYMDYHRCLDQCAVKTLFKVTN